MDSGGHAQEPFRVFIRHEELKRLKDDEEFHWLLLLARFRNAIWSQLVRMADHDRSTQSSPESTRTVLDTFFLISAYLVEGRKLALRLRGRFGVLKSFMNGLGRLLDDPQHDDLWKVEGEKGALAILRDNGVFHFKEVRSFSSNLNSLPRRAEYEITVAPARKARRRDVYYPLADEIFLCPTIGLRETDSEEDEHRKMLSFVERTRDLASEVSRSIDSLIEEVLTTQFERVRADDEPTPEQSK